MNRQIFIIGLITLFGFGLAGILLIEVYQEPGFLEVLTEGYGLGIQVVLGAVMGMASSMVALTIISRRFFTKERVFYRNLIVRLNLDSKGIVFVSLCAGIGEELFFRAGLQPFFGIWWTSLVFVMLHGYINPGNWRISLYGSVMVIIIAGFGYMFYAVGLISVMIAHALFDWILLSWLMGRVPPFFGVIRTP